MSTFQMILMVILILCLGCVGLMLALKAAESLTGKKYSIKKIFIGLKPKLFMTGALGFFFICFYGGFVFVASRLIDGAMRQQIFLMALKHPIYFVYAGLTLFIIISISILGVRSIIKRLYNTY